MEAQRSPAPLPKNFIAQAFRGATYPLAGLGYIRRHGLWPLTFAAIGINLLLLGVLITVTIVLVVPWLDQLDGTFAEIAGQSGFLQGVFSVLGWLIWVAAIAVVLVANGLFLLLIGQAVASPFLDMLSEKIEGLELGIEVHPFSAKRVVEAVALAIADLVWGVVFLAIVHIPIFIVSLVPGIGTIPAAMASFCFSALLLAHEFVGLPMTRHLVSYRARWRHVWRNKWLGLGFGSVCMLLLLVPGLNLILLPLAAAGGTLLYCDMKRGGRIGDVGTRLDS